MRRMIGYWYFATNVCFFSPESFRTTKKVSKIRVEILMDLLRSCGSRLTIVSILIMGFCDMYGRDGFLPDVFSPQLCSTYFGYKY